MEPAILLVVVVILAVTAAILAVWIRRDWGQAPSDDLPEALAAALDRKPADHGSGW